MKQGSVRERFWARVLKTDSCWIWQGPCFPNGYGMIRDTKGDVTGAHRISWKLHHGQIPRGMYVCHKCDNKKCVNPDHLFLGTPKDNVLDMINKGRIADWRDNPMFNRERHGENNGHSKLKEDHVLAIRKEYAEGKSIKILAVEYGITPTHVRYIVTRKNWSYLAEN